MPFQPGSNNYAVAFGTNPESVEVPHIDVRAPATTDTGNGFFTIGKRWINQTGNAEYTLTSFTSSSTGLSSVWTLLGTNTGALNTLTGDSGGAISPSAGNITIAGTSGQITTVGSGSTITLSLTGPYTPATYTAHSVLLGEGTSSISSVGPGATSGIPLINQAAADPIYGTAVVAGGGTGATTLTGILTGNGTSAFTANAVTNHGVLVAGASNAVSSLTVGTNGQVLLGSTGANPAFGTLTTSTGVAFGTGAAALSVDVKSGGYAINAASTGVALVAQNAYTVTQAAQTSFSLPATAAVGDRFLIASALGNTSGWIITQGASQEIWAGTNHTTNGATGTLAGAIHTSIEIMCTIANVEFIVVGGSGLTGLTFT